jgi:uncharacterized phage protein (TIGR02220 family)
MKYQIVGWDKNFENDRSRSRKSCSFVCVPNKQHGMGFSRIMAEKDGAAIYGIWHCIIGACSQQASRHGWLTFDGEQAGSAWGVDDLSLKFRRPAAEIARALSFLSSDKVEWLKCHKTSDMPDCHRALTAHSPPSTLKEEKRREEKEEKEVKELADGHRLVTDSPQAFLMPQANSNAASAIFTLPSETNEATVAPEAKTGCSKASSESLKRLSLEVLGFLNESTGRNFRETDSNLSFISKRLSEPGVTVDGVKQMIARQCERWTGTSQAEYLRPETLFNATKFDGYYASRDQPVLTNDKPEKSKHHFLI